MPNVMGSYFIPILKRRAGVVDYPSRGGATNKAREEGPAINGMGGASHVQHQKRGGEVGKCTEGGETAGEDARCVLISGAGAGRRGCEGYSVGCQWNGWADKQHDGRGGEGRMAWWQSIRRYIPLKVSRLTKSHEPFWIKSIAKYHGVSQSITKHHQVSRYHQVSPSITEAHGLTKYHQVS
ncbi:hypothetical protein GALMADRAFT_210626 [Galerina marginata CBS 339.88]|uniref:Uncharacterized protein n=1 Tax=Galerina marginata (strain CBS 339.88) TaxID=685588 RepID=A0A067TCL9_GALM3|nr:hypothetical protein GALMADRAFT_210626 [Galerina marginata CBS 339.88]